jgi:hypothetical protein
MTMPHLSNCPHDGNGWCLDCVKKMHNELEHANHRIDVLLADREQLKRLISYNETVIENIRKLIDY